MTVTPSARRPARLAAVADPSAGARVLARARRVIAQEAAAVAAVAERLDGAMVSAAEALAALAGHAVVSGLGKSFLIGQKVSATLASLGTPSFAVHAADLAHGDLGRVARGDLMVMLSFSGRLADLDRLLAHLRRHDVPLIAITGHPAAPLGRAATWTLDAGAPEEARPEVPAPTASSAAMLALGDALALAAAERRGFDRAAFAAVHPGGSLGARLAADAAEPPAASRAGSRRWP